MKEYPTISKDVQTLPIFAFNKLDGSNVRAEWNCKRSFYKFGKRHGLIDDPNPILKKAPGLIMEGVADRLDRVFRSRKWQEVVAFFEFHGPRSAFGLHEPDDIHIVNLIDISVHRKGILTPDLFLDLMQEAGITSHAALLFQGIPNETFRQQVNAGTLSGMTFEGVVCKGALESPGMPLMFKIKSDAWIEKLRSYCKGNEALFNQLL